MAVLAYRNKSILQPVVIYGIWMSIYPITTLFYYRVLNNPLNAVVPDFNGQEIRKYAELSAAAIIGLIVSFAGLKIKRENGNPIPSEILQKTRGKIFFVLSVIFLGVLYALAFKYRDIFLDAYVYQELRATNWDPRIANVVNQVTTIEILFLICIQAYLVLNTKSMEKRKIIKEILVIGLFYLALKIMIGSRILFVVYAISAVFCLVQIKSKIKYGKIVPSVLAFLVLLILFNMVRNPENGLSEAAADFGKEFVFASISAIYSVGYSGEPGTPNISAVIADTLTSIVPSSLFGGAENKFALLDYESWKESIGGYTAISPIGGYYLPGQIYLFTGSLMAVFIFFFFYGRILVAAQKSFKRSKNAWVRLVSLQILTFGVVFGVRTELWVLLKMYIQQFFILTFVLALIYSASRIGLKSRKSLVAKTH